MAAGRVTVLTAACSCRDRLRRRHASSLLICDFSCNGSSIELGLLVDVFLLPSTLAFPTVQYNTLQRRSNQIEFSPLKKNLLVPLYPASYPLFLSLWLPPPPISLWLSLPLWLGQIGAFLTERSLFDLTQQETTNSAALK